MPTSSGSGHAVDAYSSPRQVLRPRPDSSYHQRNGPPVDGAVRRGRRLDPHQIETSLFALQSPLSKGVILADEVGFGKTIEAGIVLCRLWAERRRRLLVICPASIRKQWRWSWRRSSTCPCRCSTRKAIARRGGEAPLSADAIVVMSHHYVNRLREELKIIAWDLVVIDEAHKLRNAYCPSNKVGKGIRWATEDNGMVFPPRRRSWTPRIRSRPCGDRRGRRSRSPTSTRFRRRSGGSSASSAVSARRSSRSRPRSSRSATSSSTR